VSYEEKISLTASDITSMLSETTILPADIAFLVRNGVTGLKIVYKTVDISGQPIQASGALLIPQNANPMPLISFQHGTITTESSAPSNLNSEANILPSVFASTGYIIAMPDYIGYGESKHLPHPYEHRASLATATRDMIRATYEYFKVKKTNQPNGKLFLTGYSEGGFATMATFQLLQQEHASEFNVAAVTVGAGAYNKTAFVDWVVSSTEGLEHINSFVWVLDVYNRIYPKLQRPYSFFFKEPWATTIQNGGVFASIESNPQQLFTINFSNGVKHGTDTDFISAIADNNCYSWLPSSPLQLYHGTNDTYVPYFNSETAFNAMISLGATNVELIPINEGTHETSIMQYATGTYAFFFQHLN
jgi:dipeptidyl aminopeptidase/acylaminoacyl peptidase